jgi:hypothetical protein
VTGDLLENGVEVRYEGPATLGGTGRALLRDRAGGVGEMLWEALDGAGWVGELATLRMTVALSVGVGATPAAGSRKPARYQPLPGGVRRLGEKGRVDDHGIAWQRRVGPLNGRAAGPGYRLVESERGPDELEFGDDMLYTAAVQVGWLSSAPDEVVDVPDVRIAVTVARRNPRWEAIASGTADVGSAPPSVVPTVSAIDESQLLALALEVAVQSGDPNPELVQHVCGSRFDATRTTGLTVFSDAPSYIVVMKGKFSGRRSRPGAGPAGEEVVSYPFRSVVVDIETGKIIGSRSSKQAPDLTSLGEVITDYPPG